ncbi:hypothetical protein ACFUTR_05390 [Streptomyces sp. NPDC057367]|uniref:hypothetical protein n=1 Tax=Streptomyces sp. NPDC057367 TaxID=3346108 RepID=UPI003628745D
MTVTGTVTEPVTGDVTEEQPGRRTPSAADWPIFSRAGKLNDGFTLTLVKTG